MTWKHVMTSKTRHDFKRFVMTSKIHQQFEIKWKIRHDVKKFVIKSKICHDVKKFIMHDIKNMSWHQKGSYNIKNQKHVFIIFCSRNNKINMSGAQKVSHEVKKCVNSSKSSISACQKVCHDVKSFIIISKRKVRKVRHDVTKDVMMSSLLLKENVMTSQSSLWRHQVCHDIKNTPWRQKLCHNVKSLSCSHKYVMM